MSVTLRNRIVKSALGLGAMAALWACDDATTGLDGLEGDLVDQDVALLAADAASGDLSAVTGLFLGGPSAAPGDGRMELVRSRTVDHYDASGAIQDAYDPLTTASIHTVLEVEGATERMEMEMSLSRTRDIWVTGLEGEETSRTANGGGVEARSRARMSDEHGDRTYTMSGTVLIEDVVHGVPREEFPWPLSGTITREIQVEKTGGPDGDQSFSKTVVITFDGESVVTMTVDGEAFELDLEERGRDRVRRRRGRP
jgi:hypothetical protein